METKQYNNDEIEIDLWEVLILLISKAWLIVLVGILTGILDVLPFVGTGITLLPFMLWKFVNGEITRGVILLVTFLVAATARELLEPKLIGKRMNILPVLILLAVYAGVQVFGILGVFLGPFYLMLVQECYEKIYKHCPGNENK